MKDIKITELRLDSPNYLMVCLCDCNHYPSMGVGGLPFCEFHQDRIPLKKLIEADIKMCLNYIVDPNKGEIKPLRPEVVKDE